MIKNNLLSKCPCKCKPSMRDLKTETDEALTNFKEVANEVETKLVKYDKALEEFHKVCLDHLGYTDQQMDAFKQLQIFLANGSK